MLTIADRLPTYMLDSVCVHEAAHLVCAKALEMEPEGCERDIDRHGGGRCHHRAPGWPSVDCKRRLVAILFAGRMGEEELGFGSRGSQTDEREADELIWSLPAHEQARARAWAEQAARDALEANWTLVDGIALHLNGALLI